MLFWLFVIILVVGIGFIVAGYKFSPYAYDGHFIIAGTCIVIVSSIVLIVMMFIIGSNHINIDATIEKNKETQKAIEYKVTSGACRDEFGLLSKEVIDEVQKWNEDIRYCQRAQDDFWVGIFYLNIYDQFEIIDYEKYESNIK